MGKENIEISVSSGRASEDVYLKEGAWVNSLSFDADILGQPNWFVANVSVDYSSNDPIGLGVNTIESLNSALFVQLNVSLEAYNLIKKSVCSGGRKLILGSSQMSEILIGHPINLNTVIFKPSVAVA